VTWLADQEPDQPRLWRSDGTVRGTYALTGPLDQGQTVVRGTDWSVYHLRLAGESVSHLVRVNAAATSTTTIAGSSNTGFGSWRRLGTLASKTYLLHSPASSSQEGQLWRLSPSGLSLELVSTNVLSRAWPVNAGARASKLFFTDAIGSSEGHVWETDGTSAGTRDTGVTARDRQVSSGERLFFIRPDATDTEQIWSYERGRTTQLTSFSASTYVGLRLFHSEIRGRAIVIASRPESAWDLWSSAGSPASTEKLASVCPRCTDFEVDFQYFPFLVEKVGERLYFAQDSQGENVWVSDGTAAGTRPVTGLCGGRCRDLLGFCAWGRRALVLAEATDGYELWSLDDASGSGRRLTRFTDPRPFREGTVPEERWRHECGVPTPDGAVFPVYDPRTGTEPWYTSADSPEGAFLLADLHDRRGYKPSSPETVVTEDKLALLHKDDNGQVALHSIRMSEPLSTQRTILTAGTASKIASAGSRVFARVSDPETGLPSLQAIEGTGASASVERVFTSPFVAGLLEPVGAIGERLLFVGTSTSGGGASQTELWASDGTAAGTVPITELQTPIRVDSVSLLHADGTRVFFILRNSFSRDPAQIWVSDGTRSGTTRLDLSALSGIPSSEIRRVAGQYFLGASSQEFSTPNGTHGWALLEDLPVDGSTEQASPFALAYLRFATTSPTSNSFEQGLWVQNPQTRTQRLVKALPEAPSPAETIGRLATPREIDGQLFFTAFEEGFGWELWKSDGTAEGTLRLKDIAPGPTSSRIADLTVAHGRLYFSAQSDLHGRELWISDGTEAGTRQVQDLLPGPEPGLEQLGLTAFGDHLYFFGSEGLSGWDLWALPVRPDAPACAPDETTLCLAEERFQLRAHWREPSGAEGLARAIALTDDSGYFWFFADTNIELVTKMVDGRGLNEHFWAFYGALSSVEYHLTITDSLTGLGRRYFNPPGRLASVADTTAFGPDGSPLAASLAFSPEPRAALSESSNATPGGTCEPSQNQLCLLGGRYAVRARWRDFAGNTGEGQTQTLTGDTGAFWFFDPVNLEVVLKVIDGASVNGKTWVFYGALSTVEYSLEVTDVVTGQVKTYRNQAGELASRADLSAF
jgi:ELWxxDGT repeat protein